MANDKKIFMVVNPNSANGSTGRNWPQMETTINQELGSFEYAFTKSGGDATRITSEAIAKGFDLIVAVGGDGTNNEVINGFFDGEKQLDPQCGFGFICRGTGGDFRKTFGWSTDLHEALARLKSDDYRKIDLGRFSYINHDGNESSKYFINITSFGIGGLVDHLVNNTTKIFGGKASFMMATARALASYRNKKVKITIDDSRQETHVVNNVAIANGRFFGGGMMIAPEAEVDDGMLDVVILGDMSRTEVVLSSSQIYKGTHIKNEKVLQFKAKKIVAESDEKVLLDMDGEQPGCLPCVFEIVESCLNLKV